MKTGKRHTYGPPPQDKYVILLTYLKNKDRKYSSKQSKRHQSTINVNTVANDEWQATTEREVFTQPWLSKE